LAVHWKIVGSQKFGDACFMPLVTRNAFWRMHTFLVAVDVTLLGTGKVTSWKLTLEWAFASMIAHVNFQQCCRLGSVLAIGKRASVRSRFLMHNLMVTEMSDALKRMHTKGIVAFECSFFNVHISMNIEGLPCFAFVVAPRNCAIKWEIVFVDQHV